MIGDRFCDCSNAEARYTDLLVLLSVWRWAIHRSVGIVVSVAMGRAWTGIALVYHAMLNVVAIVWSMILTLYQISNAAILMYLHKLLKLHIR